MPCSPNHTNATKQWTAQKCQYPSPIHPCGKQKGSTLPFKLSHLPLKLPPTHTLFANFELWPPVHSTNVFPWTPPKPSLTDSYPSLPLKHPVKVALQLLGPPDGTHLFHGSLKAASEASKFSWRATEFEWCKSKISWFLCDTKRVHL